MALHSKRFEDWQSFIRYLGATNFRMGKNYSNSGKHWREYNYAKRNKNCAEAYLFITGEGVEMANGSIILSKVKVVGLVYYENYKRQYKLFHGKLTARALYAKHKYKEKIGHGFNKTIGVYKRQDQMIDAQAAALKQDMPLNSKETHETLDDLL